MDIPEILENILFQLDMRTLLSVQRVCHSWYHAIATAPSLQRKLFFLPAPDSEKRMRNPLLSELFPQWFACNERNKEDHFGPRHLTTPSLGKNYRNSSFRYKEASWRRMLLTQPPIRSLTRCAYTFHMANLHVELTNVLQDRTKLLSHEGSGERELVTMPEKALRMERFYSLVTSGLGDAQDWLFIWDNPEDPNPIPSKFQEVSITKKEQTVLESGLKRDGLVMLELSSTLARGNSHWRFGGQYRVQRTSPDVTLQGPISKREISG